jgi:hypothetical protein
MADRISVPFTIEPTAGDYRRGVFAVRGIVAYRDGALLVEYQTKNALWQDSEPGAVSIGLDQLRAVEFRRRLGGGELRLHGHSLTTFHLVPGHRGDHLRLRIGAGDRAEAQNAASLLRLQLEHPGR